MIGVLKTHISAHWGQCMRTTSSFLSLYIAPLRANSVIHHLQSSGPGSFRCVCTECIIFSWNTLGRFKHVRPVKSINNFHPSDVWVLLSTLQDVSFRHSLIFTCKRVRWLQHGTGFTGSSPSASSKCLFSSLPSLESVLLGYWHTCWSRSSWRHHGGHCVTWTQRVIYTIVGRPQQFQCSS